MTLHKEAKHGVWTAMGVGGNGASLLWGKILLSTTLSNYLLTFASKFLVCLLTRCWFWFCPRLFIGNFSVRKYPWPRELVWQTLEANQLLSWILMLCQHCFWNFHASKAPLNLNLIPVWRYFPLLIKAQGNVESQTSQQTATQNCFN